MENSNHSHFLNPSKIFVSRQAYEVITVLGSCVAVCLYDRKQMIGGINHYMLPFWNGNELPSPKYGNIAIEKLIDKMLNYGANKNDLIAKVFGGSGVIEVSHEMFRIGQKNLDVAFQTLERENIPVIRHSTGGQTGRKILFRTETGEVRMKYVGRQQVRQLIHQSDV